MSTVLIAILGIVAGFGALMFGYTTERRVENFSGVLWILCWLGAIVVSAISP